MILPTIFLCLCSLATHRACFYCVCILLHRKHQCLVRIEDVVFFFQKPCVILREQTEWIEIIENGNALIAGANELKIISSVETLIKRTDFTYPNLYGYGNAANFICKKITEEL